MTRPTLRTARLVLRPFVVADAPAVQRLASDPAVAGNATGLPLPFVDGMAEVWIRSHGELWASGHLNLAVEHEGGVVGAVGLRLEPEHDRAELGFWIGRPCWGRGLATEGAAALVRHGFEALGVGRIYASHLGPNVASGRVLEKLGFRHEGTLRRHVRHEGRLVDLIFRGRLHNE